MDKKKMSAKEGVQRLWDVARDNPIPGLRIQHQREFESGELPSQILSPGFYLNWERGWGVDAKLRVCGDVEKGLVILRVEVGWSSSTYAPHAARTAADLHARVADLACWMQTVIDSLPPLAAKDET